MNNEGYLRTLGTRLPVIVLPRAEEIFPSLEKNVRLLHSQTHALNDNTVG
jgi:hypothetical protein